MTRRTPFVAAAAALAVVGALLVLVVLPRVRQAGDARERLDAAARREVFLRAERDRLRALSARLPEIRRELRRFDAGVPSTPDLPGVIRLLEAASVESGLESLAVRPGGPAPIAGLGASVIPTRVVIVGGFFEVDDFLLRLETLSRASRVNGLRIGPGPEGLPQLRATLSIQVFTTDPSVGPGAADPGAPGANATPAPGASPTSSSTESGG